MLTSRALVCLPLDQVAYRRGRVRLVGAEHEHALTVATDLLVEVVVCQGRREVNNLTRLL